MIVMDIDGVLADARHRLHLIRQHPKKWDEFYERAKDDLALSAGRHLYCALREYSPITLLSGRRKSIEVETHQWLERHGFADYDELILRPDGDHRPAMVFKLEALRRLPDKIALVVDDDPKVCLALSSAGYSVLQPWWAHEHDADVTQSG
jgi:hypothetical protein